MANSQIPRSADDCLISPFSPLVAASTLHADELTTTTTIKRPRSLSTPSIPCLSPYHDIEDMHLSLIHPKDGLHYFDLETSTEITNSLHSLNLSTISTPQDTSAENSAPQSSTSPSTVYMTPESLYHTPLSCVPAEFDTLEDAYEAQLLQKQCEKAMATTQDHHHHHHQPQQQQQQEPTTPSPAPRSWAVVASTPGGVIPSTKPSTTGVVTPSVSPSTKKQQEKIKQVEQIKLQKKQEKKQRQRQKKKKSEQAARRK